jgi:hypothetical protein
VQTEKLGVLKVRKLVAFPVFEYPIPQVAEILSLILLIIFLLIQGYKLFLHRNFHGNDIDYIDNNAWKAYCWTEKL